MITVKVCCFSHGFLYMSGCERWRWSCRFDMPLWYANSLLHTLHVTTFFFVVLVKCFHMSSDLLCHHQSPFSLGIKHVQCYCTCAEKYVGVVETSKQKNWIRRFVQTDKHPNALAFVPSLFLLLKITEWQIRSMYMCTCVHVHGATFVQGEALPFIVIYSTKRRYMYLCFVQLTTPSTLGAHDSHPC